MRLAKIARNALIASVVFFEHVDFGVAAASKGTDKINSPFTCCRVLATWGIWGMMWEGARSCRVLANRRSKMDHAHGVGGRSYIHFCYVRTFVGSLHKQDLGMIAHQNTYVRTYVLSWNMQSRIKRSRLMALASWLLPCGARLLPLTNQPIPICTALGPNPRKLFCCELLGVVRTRPATVVLWSR